MKGIEFAEVRDAITRAFTADDFDQLLYERLEFNRPVQVADGPFKVVVSNVLKAAQMEGWDPILIAEVAAARPLKQEVQEIYARYGEALVDEARQQVVEEQRRKAMERFGLGPRVNLQRGGSAQLPSLPPATNSGLERKIKQYLPFLDVGLWRARVFQMEGRVCRIEIGNDAAGTGFLVGPDVLLTNYHVMAAVIGNPALAPTVRFRFDYQALAGGTKSEGLLVSLRTPDWLIDSSPYTSAEAKNRPDDTVPTVDELDYALLRLDRPLGDEPLNPNIQDSRSRGWIPVPVAPPLITQGMPILILQHPKGDPLKLAIDTEGVISVSPQGTRVRYATNTEGGSSGSPCFDIDWNLIALHHYGDPLHDRAQYNQGVPIHMIRGRLKRIGKDDALGGPLPT